MGMRRKINRGFIETRLLIGGFSIFLVLVLIFALSRAYGLIQGPVIELNTAVLASEISDGFVVLQGKVYRNAYFAINGRVVAPEQNGNFEERLFLTPGHTIMTIQARDRFDRTTQEIIPIYVPEYASEEKDNSQESSTEEERGSANGGDSEGSEE